MEDTIKILGEAFGKLVVYLVVGAFAAYLIHLLWGFALVPFGAPDFTFSQTWGIMILLGIFGVVFRGNDK